MRNIGLPFVYQLLIFGGILLQITFAQGSFHIGGHTSYRVDVPNTTLFGRAVPSIFRAGLMGIYHSSGPISLTAEASYRLERGQVSQRDIGMSFSFQSIAWQYHFFNPEILCGYRLVLNSGVGITFQAGLGANIPIWNRTLTIETNGQPTLLAGPLESEFANQYLILGLEIPIYSSQGLAFTVQPEYARPFKTGERLRPTHELGFSLIIRGGGV